MASTSLNYHAANAGLSTGLNAKVAAESDLAVVTRALGEARQFLNGIPDLAMRLCGPGADFGSFATTDAEAAEPATFPSLRQQARQLLDAVSHARIAIERISDAATL